MTDSDSYALILGCGPSGGVPLLSGDAGGYWGNCDPTNPKNRRTRASVLVTFQGRRFLVDTSPDLRFQCLTQGVSGVDAVLYTHAHADHLHGIDDLRPLYFAQGKKPLPCYADPKILKILTSHFAYLFEGGSLDIYPKILQGHPLVHGKNQINKRTIIAFPQAHGPHLSLGFRFGDFAYSTDFKHLSEEALNALRGVKIWVVDCLSREEKPTHCHLDLALSWIEKVAPKKAYLTHMNQTLDYATLKKELPPHVEPAYDGLRIPF